MPLKTLLLLLPAASVPVALSGQGRGLDPAELLKPLGESWPTYSGDYSAKRYSSLKQINQTTVKNLTLAWVAPLQGGPGGGGGRGVNIGGEGTGEFPFGGVNIKA